MTAETMTFTRPDDWHVHLRDGPMLAAVVADTARSFARAIVMPNLKPPVTDRDSARRYREAIRAALPAATPFEPLMTCYLTDLTDADDLAAGALEGIVTAAKLYPAGATTNSDAGVTDVRRLDRVFEVMSAHAMPLLIHGEVVDDSVDIFDREAFFIDRVLIPLRARHPDLKIVFEHITTSHAVDYVKDADPALLGATITPHHLTINRNAMLVGGIRPHMYCLPVAKRESHRCALVAAACSGDAHFFLGTDSAPHVIATKESACGCAGIYNSRTAVETYLQVFDDAGRLDSFQAFAAENGPRFYGLPRNTETVSYQRSESPEPAGVLEPDDLDTPVGPVRVFATPQASRWQRVTA